MRDAATAARTGLTVFLSDTETPMADLSRDLDIPLTTLHRDVEQLEEAGLLTSRRISRTRMIRANREHPAAGPLTDLLTVTFGPAQVIAEEFAAVGADTVIIFGSWARRYRGEPGDFPRDVDVLVVGDYNTREATYNAADAAHKRLGIEVNPVIRTAAEWNAKDPDPLVTDIRTRPFIEALPTDRPTT